MTYDQIGNTAPCGFEHCRKKRKLKAWHVLLFFVADMTIFLFAGSYVQYYLGMAGVAITELWLLASSLVFVWLMGADFRMTFPIRKPRPLALAGTLVIWVGGFFSVLICNLVLLVLFPQGMVSNGESFSVILNSVPWPAAFLVIAVLPAICEEAMHRGVIQCGIQNSIHSKWAVVLIMGLLFGAFHLSPVKFLGTGILGAVMSWILLSTDSMVYSSFFHFFHNGLQLVLLMILPGVLETSFFGASAFQDDLMKMGSALPVYALGLYMAIFGTAVPILIYVGNWLIRKSLAPVKPAFLPKGKEKITLCKILIPTAAILVTGILITGYGFSQMLASMIAK